MRACSAVQSSPLPLIVFGEGTAPARQMCCDAGGESGKQSRLQPGAEKNQARPWGLGCTVRKQHARGRCFVVGLGMIRVFRVGLTRSLPGHYKQRITADPGDLMKGAASLSDDVAIKIRRQRPTFSIQCMLICWSSATQRFLFISMQAPFDGQQH